MMALSELSKVHRRINPQTNEPYAPTTNRSLITEYRNIIKAELGENASVLDTFKYSAARVTDASTSRSSVRNGTTTAATLSLSNNTSRCT
ncbi:hypothetical protein [Streptomyces panaciradicis]|uniref:hypothetical protein n=1 Tax=Streptomyces panaciradicis TaxID=1470261 RepID=UPI00201CBF77|nr:hypothetical protein [Streptomyces panaciradicis]MCL6670502.1 hypothetical protein [Streptomyces panaciradicis]